MLTNDCLILSLAQLLQIPDGSTLPFTRCMAIVAIHGHVFRTSPRAPAWRVSHCWNNRVRHFGDTLQVQVQSMPVLTHPAQIPMTGYCLQTSAVELRQVER